MLAKQVKPLLSEDDYLEMERVSKIRHEYVEGTIYAMAGGSRSHNKIAMKQASRCINTLKARRVMCI